MSDADSFFAPIEIDLAWAAGFLDGEGHFGLARDGGRRSRTPLVEAAQVATRIPLDKLAEMFGGSVNRRPAGHRWQVASAPKVQRLCVLLIPFLVVKREQAEVLLRFTMTVGRRGANTLPFGVREVREQCALELRALRAAR